MKFHQFFLRPNNRFLLLLFALSMTACAGSSPPVTYYQLSAMAPVRSSPNGKAFAKMVVGIDSVRVADYLDRPQLVVRQGDNRVRLSGSHRWVEPLAANIARVMGGYIQDLTGAANVLLPSWNTTMAVNYQISVEMVRFEGNGFEEGVLEAVWSIRDGKGNLLVPPKHSEYTVNAAGAGYEGVVRALNEALFRLSSEIVNRLQQISPAVIDEKRTD